MAVRSSQASRCLLITVVLTLPSSACDSGPADPSLESNVIVYLGATDVPLLNLGDDPILRVQHSTAYVYGRLHEPGDDELVRETWMMDMSRRIVTRENEDTIVYRYLDFGDVALEGTPARRIELDSERVHTGGDRVQVDQNVIIYQLPIYVHRLNMDGSSVSFVREPFYQRMVGSSEVTFTASGSADLEPTSASLTFRPGARVTSLWNGDPVAFNVERPVLRTDQPLVVELSRPLDPDQSVLYLSYFPPSQSDEDLEVGGRARAAFKLRERTDRVVIPASALAEVASHLPDDEGEFVFSIDEYLLKDDALEIVRVEDGTRESLSGLQVNGFGFYLRMRR